MGPKQFFLRVIAVIVGVVTFHILGIEFLVFFVMAPSLREFGIMLMAPLPLALLLVGTYIVITYYYIRPVYLFLSVASEGEEPAFSSVKIAQDRCINLPYFLSALSFPAYILGGIGGVWLASRALGGWPSYIMIFGALAGVIAGLVTIPMAEYFAAWATHPALRTIMKHSPGFERARTAGLWVSMRMKFVLTVVVMVVGISGYAVVISYGLIDSAIDNMAQIEKMLPPAAAAVLADHSLGTSDARAKSSFYFRSRLGNLKLFFAGVMIGGFLLALAVSFVAADSITRPLRIFSKVAEKIRTGRYNETVEIITNDEFAELGASFNRMTGVLVSQLEQNRALIESIREAVETLGPMSKELVGIADQQAAASVEQAAATESAADAGREIADVARQIAENTAHVSRESEAAQQLTREGQLRLDQTEGQLEKIAERMRVIVDSVVQLEVQSREIDDIVETIKKLSGQTNILSLNAGIEAIKAGDEGQRFGVVAKEIRRLARDSGQSAKRIRGNIERIQESVATSIGYAEEGAQAVQTGKDTMLQMKAQFDKISDANIAAVRELEQVEAMTSRQADANEQLSSIIAQIKEGTHETSASAEQTHNALRTLKDLVTQLQGHIGKQDGDRQEADRA